MKTFVVLFGLFAAISSFAASKEAYYQLALKDLDQMTVLVKKRVEASRKGSDKLTPLKEGLQLVYSRPNQDGMIDKVVGPLRTEIDENEAWEKTVTELCDEAIASLKEPKDLRPADQVTYAIFLENIIAEFRPRARDEGFEKALLTKIVDADLTMSKEARNERQVRTMKELVSPSRLAALALGPDEKNEKKKKK